MNYKPDSEYTESIDDELKDFYVTHDASNCLYGDRLVRYFSERAEVSVRQLAIDLVAVTDPVHLALSIQVVANSLGYVRKYAIPGKAGYLNTISELMAQMDDSGEFDTIFLRPD